MLARGELAGCVSAPWLCHEGSKRPAWLTREQIEPFIMLGWRLDLQPTQGSPLSIQAMSIWTEKMWGGDSSLGNFLLLLTTENG